MIGELFAAEVAAQALGEAEDKSANPSALVSVTVSVPRSRISEIKWVAERMRTEAGYKPGLLARIAKAWSRR